MAAPRVGYGFTASYTPAQYETMSAGDKAAMRTARRAVRWLPKSPVALDSGCMLSKDSRGRTHATLRDLEFDFFNRLKRRMTKAEAARAQAALRAAGFKVSRLRRLDE